MQVTDDATGDYPLLKALEGKPCSFCDGGRLIRGSYKGNAAAICDTCETPRAQLFDR